MILLIEKHDFYQVLSELINFVRDEEICFVSLSIFKSVIYFVNGVEL